MASAKRGLATTAIHTSIPKESQDTRAAVVTPIVTASTFRVEQDYDLGDPKWDEVTNVAMYGRYGNTTRNTLEATIAALEGAKECMVFSSGMAATNAVVEALLRPGDQIVTPNQIYGGSFNLFSRELPELGIQVTFVEDVTPAAIASELTDKTKLVWIEACSNPLLQIADLRAIVDAVKSFRKDICVAVDNTFLSPHVLRPLEFGLDIVMHSCTKYLCGHSDVVMGCLSAVNPDLCKKLRKIQQQRGATPSSFDCYLMQRSLSTLEVRMERHHENALKLAKYLQKHPAVERVFHPLLESHASHHLAMTQHGGKHSGMIAIYIRGNEEATKVFLASLQLMEHAVSLGGVHTLVSCPKKLSHAYLTEEARQKVGITNNLVRISVGLETADDLIKDLDQALIKAQDL